MLVGARLAGSRQCGGRHERANDARQACVDSSIERSIFRQDTVYRLVIMQPSLSGL